MNGGGEDVDVLEGNTPPTLLRGFTHISIKRGRVVDEELSQFCGELEHLWERHEMLIPSIVGFAPGGSQLAYPLTRYVESSGESVNVTISLLEHKIITQKPDIYRVISFASASEEEDEQEAPHIWLKDLDVGSGGVTCWWAQWTSTGFEWRPTDHTHVEYLHDLH